MVDEPLLTPRQAAGRLGVPSSTLRAYATEFQPFLSASARGGGGADVRAFRHRRYSEADLVILQRAQALLDTGLNYAAARERLAGHRLESVVPRRRNATRLPQRSRSVGGRASGRNAIPAGERPRIVHVDSELRALGALADLNARLASVEATLGAHGERLSEIRTFLMRTPMAPIEEPPPEPRRRSRGGLVGWLARFLS